MLSAHLRLTHCPLCITCKCLLGVFGGRIQVTENEVGVSIALGHSVIQGSRVILPQCSCKHPLAHQHGFVASALPRSCRAGVLCLYQQRPDREERQVSEGCVRAVTASVPAISMVPRQGDNLIRLFSASRREGEWRETGRRGPAFPAACLSPHPL